MIARYTHPDMGRIWSDQRRYESWLLVESAAADAMAAAGIVPADAARDIRERGAFEIARIEEIERTTQHDVIAFTTAVAEHVGPSARWLHFGLTSSDVIDTAQALQMREACDAVLKDLAALSAAITERAFAQGQKGSSAMPHKRNPIGCEQIVGMARLLRGNAHAALENVALWHERDISHSSVERVILPDSFIALDHMLRRFTRIVQGMIVHPERMRENLDRSRGVVFSGTVLLELARKGVTREQAYEWVQRNAMQSFAEQREFKALLLADPDISGVLSRADIERTFDLDEQLQYVGHIFDRVFHAVH